MADIMDDEDSERQLEKEKAIKKAYEVLKPYYKEAGIPFSMKDAETARLNMIRLAQKLLEINEKAKTTKEKNDRHNE